MNLGQAHFQTTAAILQALLDQVQGLQGLYADGMWTADDSEPLNSSAFGQVKIFDLSDLVEAFKWLLITDQRICVIVPTNIDWHEESSHTKAIVRRSFSVALLISDRVLGDRTAALLGNNNTPGAMGLKDLVLPAVTGQLIANPSGVTSRPTREYVVHVKDNNKKLPNRVTMCLEVECRGGRIDAVVQPVM